MATTLHILAAITFRDTEDVFCALSIELGLDVPATAPERSQIRATRYASEVLVSMCRTLYGKGA